MAGDRLDYEKLGLKCGLEIHQQIKGKKLFCSCPCLIRDDAPDKTIKRRLRASAGETGTTDIAARHEAKKEKTYAYELYQDSTCLVELDEEPPHDLNMDALRVVLEFSTLAHATIVDQVHVMRKTVVDGSNTSAFQRTALVARNGSMNVAGKTIHLPTICLEEDAARIISRATDETVYRLDRLGIPLIEIATDPDIRSPEECKAVAAEIGMYLRSTGNVMRGSVQITGHPNGTFVGTRPERGAARPGAQRPPSIH